jgi:hypothetical protein
LIFLRGVKHQELGSILQFIYLGEARFYEGNIDRFMEAVTDLQIKQLTECFMTAGNPFINREEPDGDDNMSSTICDQNILTNIDAENETEVYPILLNWTSGYTTLVVSLVVNCISVRNVRQCLKVRVVYLITKDLSMKVLCIPVTSVSLR